MPWLIRVVCVLLFVTVGVFLSRKTSVLRARWKKALYILASLLVSVALVLFPLEYFFYGFPSIELALRFSSPGFNVDAMEVLKGEHSALVLAPEKRGGGVGVAVLEQAGTNWKGMTARDALSGETGFNTDASVTLYQCGETGERYAVVTPVMDKALTVSDTEGTTFIEVYGQYVGYVGEIQGEYHLYVNDEELLISGLSP